jgi:peptidoglycan-N-acetylglucosamine deacetylase
VPSFQEQLDTIARWRELPGLERAAGEGGTAHLTFDDGPDSDATPEVLDALDAAGLKATFFLVGEQVMAHREIGRSVVERGHEVALHGHEHRSHDEMGGAVRDDLARGLGTLEAGTGVRPRLYRPPYGRFSAASYGACEALELRPVYWSAWGGDWEAVPADRIADLVIRDLEPGAIVVLHDSARYAHRPSARPTAEAIPLIAEAAAERGIKLGPLREAAG